MRTRTAPATEDLHDLTAVGARLGVRSSGRGIALCDAGRRHWARMPGSGM